MGRGKRRRRIKLILVTAGGIVALGAGAYGLRQWQLDRTADAARDEGRAALDARDWPAALDGIGRYLQRHGESKATSEDYVLYARARRHVEVPNARHLTGAIASLRKAREQDPGNAEAKAELLDLYLEVGYTTETLELLDAMLASSPDDLHLLRTQRDVLESALLYPRALAVAKRIDELAPRDVSDHFVTLRLYLASGAPAAEVDAWTDGVVAAHADDPRFELLHAAVFTRRDDAARAKQSLDRVLAATSADAEPAFVTVLVAELDAAGRVDDSLRVLDRAGAGTDPDLRRELLRRLFYAGRLREIAERADLRDAESVRSDPEHRPDPEVMALRAIALGATGDAAGAALLRRDLENRTDKTGAAWAIFVESTTAGATPPSIASLAAAVAAVPRSACLRQALGDRYAALGETDLALETWTEAARRAPSWGLPLRRISDALIATGREHLAPVMARAALTVSPNDVESMAAYVRATASVSARLDPSQIQTLLKAVAALEKTRPDRIEETLPIHVGLLVRADKGAAETLLVEVADGRIPASEATLLRLASIADAAGIPIADRLLALSEERGGPSPHVAFVKATRLARKDGADAGLHLLDESRMRAGQGAVALDWDIVRATYLDAVGRPDAGAAWISLSAANPGVLVAQLGALASSSAWADRKAIDRVIERTRELTGDDAVTWRVARGRWLLTDPEVTESEIADAARILSDVTQVAPKNDSARLLLAQAFEKLHNLAGAEEQLRLASDLAPDDPTIALEMARLAQIEGRPDVTRRQLDRVLAGPRLEPRHVERAAYLLAAQGDRRRGADLLEPLVSRRQSGREGVLLLARLYARLGEPERALVLCRQLLSDPDVTVLETVAELESSLGRSDEAETALAQLDSVAGARPGDRELARARHASSWKSAPVARDWFRKAVAAASDRPDVWTAYLEFAVASGDAESVAAALDDPRAGGVEPVRFLAGIRPLCLVAVGDERLRILVLASIDEQGNRPVYVDAIRRMSTGWTDPAQREATSRAIRELADSNVRLLPLQLLVADVALASGDLRGACEIARRAMRQFPNSAAAARQASETSARAERWNDVLEAATLWRERAASTDTGPVVFVAEALTRLGRPAQGAAKLEPYVAAALARPDGNATLLVNYAVSLVRSGEGDRATRTLADLAARSPSWRVIPLHLDFGRLDDAAQAKAWLSACAANVPRDDVAARIELARAWGSAWEKFHAPELLAGANEVLASIRAGEHVSSDVDVLVGTLAQQSGDLETARRSYAAALARDPGRFDARNNLAMVLADTGRWKEAVEEAGKAARAAPQVADIHDTLAYALRKGGEFEQARRSIDEAIKLEPWNPAWQATLAEILGAAGHNDEMGRAVFRFDEMVSHGAALPARVRDRIEKLRASPR